MAAALVAWSPIVIAFFKRWFSQVVTAGAVK